MKKLKQYIKRLAALGLLFSLAGGAALADNRTDLVLTTPSSSRVVASHVGVGLSYDLLNYSHFGIAPLVVVTNLSTNPKFQPGVEATYKLGRVDFGFGALLRPGASATLHSNHYDGVFTVGVRL